jgi:hypothetical protein
MSGIDTSFLWIGLVCSGAAVIVCFTKDKYVMGVLGVFWGLIAIIGALRLAPPDTPWAHAFYPPGSEKLARSERRYPSHVRRERPADGPPRRGTPLPAA